MWVGGVYLLKIKKTKKGRRPCALEVCLATMTDLDNVQEVDERKRTGMEKMSVDEELFEQILEATVQKLSRTEFLVRRVLSRAQSQLAADGPVKQTVPDTVRLEGLLPFTKQLEVWRLDGNLTDKLVRKSAKHDRSPGDLESDLNKHIVCSKAAAHAFDGKVHTEEDFLEKDLCGVLQPRVWDLVLEAQKYWRKTTMIGNLYAAGKLCLILVYRCDIWRASAEDTKTAVSFSSKHRHTQPRAQPPKTARMLRALQAERSSERRL